MTKICLLYLICLTLCPNARSQSRGGFEQYYYVGSQAMPAMVPVVHYNTTSNWYGEARYNYEDINTLSLYCGKTFLKDGGWAWSATPLVGGMMGSMNGGSLGFNFEMDHENAFLSSHSQYSFSSQDHMNKYFFTWSEVGYKALPWCYAGVAVQQTSMFRQTAVCEPGCMVGFSFGKWTIPCYAFSLSKKDKYFVLGVNWEWLTKPKEVQTVVLK